MPNFLIGTSYGVSAGLIIYAVAGKLAPDGWAFGLIFAWALAGLALAFTAVLAAYANRKRVLDSAVEIKP